MFDNINLLPEDLREREEKERKKLGKEQGFGPEELSFPSLKKERSEDLNLREEEKIKPGGWQIKEEPIKKKEVELGKGKGEKKITFLERFKNLFKKRVRIEEKKALEKKIEEIKPITPQEKKPILPKREIVRPPTEILPPVEPPPQVKVEIPTKKISEIKKIEETKPLESKLPTLKKEKFNFNKFLNLFKFQKKKVVEKTFKPEKEKTKIPLGFTSGDKLTAPSDSLEVNLVPLSQGFLPLAKINSYFIWTIIINLLIVGVLYGIIILYNYRIKLETDIQDQKITEKLTAISKLQPKEKEVEGLLAEIKQVEQILNKHLYWTNFFDNLEDYTLNNVYYTDFAATSEGNITLSAITTDYQSVAKQIIALRNSKNFIKEVKVLGAKKNAGGTTAQPTVSFSISLVLDPQVFLKPLTYE